MRKLCLLLLLCVGCSPYKPPPPPPVPMPPLFMRGDTVKIANSNSLGIVRSSHYVEGMWQYEVMFADQELSYTEENLSLEHRAVWFLQPLETHFPQQCSPQHCQPIEPAIKAEIEQPPPNY